MSAISSSTKVLLDTDIGSDIDDAICLAYLLAQPKCDLLGITTVTGEAEKRAMVASALCKAAGKEIPIYPGAEMPLLVPQWQKQAPQAVALSRRDHDTTFPQGQAVEFMRQAIRIHPGEVILLAVGPLTNVALLFAVDTEIPFLLKGLVLMCGTFGNCMQRSERVEWNAKLDPYATAMVYQAKVPVHRSIGLDVTAQVTMQATQVRNRFSIHLLQSVLDFAEVWFQKTDIITFHDPLAAATIFDDQICVFIKGTVEVELGKKELRGFTHWEPNGSDAHHEVAMQVDSARFFEHFFSVFK